MRRVTIVGLPAFFVAVFVFPLVFANPAVTSIAVFALIYALAATSWNIFSGYTGYFSLGHSTFFGLGAYALGLMCQDWNIQGGYAPFLLLPLVGLIAAAFAIPLGWIALRTRRFTFVVITIAFVFIFQLLAYNLEGLTNGSRGMYLPFPPWSGDVYSYPFYYVAFGLLLLALGTSWWVRNSKFGLGLLAIRDDEDRALGLGIRTGQFKLGAFVISAFFLGMAGAMNVYFIGFFSPSFVFAPVFDVTIALMALAGGVGTLAGPILGALALEPLQQYLTLQNGVNGLDLVLFGGLLLLVIIFLPDGIIPALRRRWAAWMESRSARRVTVHVKEQEDSLAAESGRGKG
jgi:branched-chain amino acid transport system permease protein